MPVVCSMLLASCAEFQFFAHTTKRIQKAHEGDGGGYKVGKPYQIMGRWYYPAEDYGYVETGIASWYGRKFHGKKTANGETYDMNALTAAHRTLPMPSYVRVTNLDNGRSLVLMVNDRGPFAHNRIIDVSRRGAQLLGYERQGTARVRVEIMVNESRTLAARLKGQTQLAAAGSPITVDKLPKAPVNSEPLPLPPGGAKSLQPVKAAATPPPPPPLNGRRAAPAALSAPPKLGVVISRPVAATRLFVQAGAYGRHDNANQVRAKLSGLGQSAISRVLVNGRDLFRVRLGPLADVASADQILGWVIQAGFNDARIIVE